MIAHALLVGPGRLELRRPAGRPVGGSALIMLPLAVMLMHGPVVAALISLLTGIAVIVRSALLRGVRDVLRCVSGALLRGLR